MPKLSQNTVNSVKSYDQTMIAAGICYSQYADVAAIVQLVLSESHYPSLGIAGVPLKTFSRAALLVWAGSD
jgi:hypothetical protein